MGEVFDEASNFLGLNIETFEIVFSSAFILFFILVIVFFIALKKRKGRVELSKVTVKDLKDDLAEAQERMKASEKERLSILKQHEEALAKLKEAKEMILKREDDFKNFKGGFQEDFSKISAMEEELKTYRIKLGEINKEKQALMANYESDNQAREEENKKTIVKFEKEIEAQKKKIKSINQDLEDEMDKKERLHQRRIDEIKSQAKEAMIKLTMEKDREISDLKIEHEKTSKQVVKLKDEIRVLEIDKL
jgi:chromosome segregation ATPase